MVAYGLLLSSLGALLRPRASPANPLRQQRAGISPTMTVAPGASVVLCGSGPMLMLTAKLAALRGFETTCAAADGDIAMSSQLIYTTAHPEGSLPITMLPISGPDADMAVFGEKIAAADALIIAFDGERSINEAALNAFMKPGGKLQHVSLMSRYLNGEGMGFFASAAKKAANAEVWAGGPAVSMYRDMEKLVLGKAKEVGAATTVVRAGTLKGGACGDSLSGGSGEPAFLNPYFYSLGQQDVVNWRLLFDCASLGVKLVRGDTLPGPGFTAALTATSAEAGAGDTHRGALAMALVESLLAPAASDGDFSVASTVEKTFPPPEAWPAMFDQA